MYIDCLQAVDGKVHFVYKKESAIHSFFYFISFSFISQIYEYIININLFAPFYSKYWIFLYFKHALLGHFKNYFKVFCDLTTWAPISIINARFGRQVAVVENFFNIIYSVHVESSADTQVLKEQFIS